MINIFLRADEIEMVMTDLERANQVRRLIRWHILTHKLSEIGRHRNRERQKCVIYLFVYFKLKWLWWV